MSPISLEEAWEKQCPYQPRRCIGLDCMAWIVAERGLPSTINATNRTAASIEEAGDRPEGVYEDWTFVPETRNEWAHWIAPKGSPNSLGRCRLIS